MSTLPTSGRTTAYDAVLSVVSGASIGWFAWWFGGAYVVSDGSGKPHKCRLRSPCFAIMQALDTVLLPGSSIADVVPIFGSVNMIAGECDR